MYLRLVGSTSFLLFFILPLVCGLLFTILPSLGYESWDEISFTLQYWKKVFLDPRSVSSIFLSIKISVLSTLISLGIVFLLGGCLCYTRLWKKFESILPFFLSVPHAAFSIGLVFLVAPSGLFFRLVSIFVSDFSPPTHWVTYQDKGGYALILALIFKEVPFLIFIVFSRLSQIRSEVFTQVSRTMGYSLFKTWMKVIWPQIYSGLRFPIFIILSYCFSVVDMSYILGPSTPPPFILLILEWFQNDNLEYQKVASAGAILLVFILLLVMLTWVGGEKLMSRWIHYQYSNGNRGWKWAAKITHLVGIGMLLFLIIMPVLTFLVNIIWSFSRRWSFPALLPQAITLKYWENFLMMDSIVIFFNTFFIAIVATILSLFLVIVLLESKEYSIYRRQIKIINHYQKSIFSSLTFLIYLPLLIPQILLLLGIQFFFLYTLPNDNYSFYFKVIWAHFFFVLPYIYLTMSDSYKKYDQRYIYVSQTFAKNKWEILWKIKWPMLRQPILFSLAIGFSVSVMEYLSSVIMGAGRIETITTEAVNLSIGGNRRWMGLYSTLQMIFPFMIFLFCIFLNRRISRRYLVVK